MAIYLPGTGDESALTPEEMTPREIVAALDKYVVGAGGGEARRGRGAAESHARQKLAPELADEVSPKNILMIGSTGVGKTEIARRLAKLSGAPFLKVEASKFTEVGYVGRDVESMIRDLVETSIDMVREEKLDEIEDRAELAAEERLIDLLLARAAKAGADEKRVGASDQGLSRAGGESGDKAGDEGGGQAEDEGGAPAGIAAEEQERGVKSDELVSQASGEESGVEAVSASAQRERLRQQLREGKLDDETVELERATAIRRRWRSSVTPPMKWKAAGFAT